jgi:ArsR family transcriptional regulator
VVAVVSPSWSRAELFRLLGDEDRLRLLALCAEEELTVGELAGLLHEAQPQVTKKSQPLREAGLLSSRKDGTRTLLKAVANDDAVIAAALEEGRTLCARDGSLARVGAIVAQREELSRRAFDAVVDAPVVVDGAELLPMLPALRALLPGNRLAVDVGTGEGALLPMLAPLYERVVAVDRSAARLARCALRVESLNLPNVRLLEADVDSAQLLEDITGRGGADLVVMARVLRHVARPQDAVTAAARLLRAGGHLIVVDALPHEDERLREQGDVWLGFQPMKLQQFLEGARLEMRALEPLARFTKRSPDEPLLQIAVGRKPTAQ